MNVDDFTDSLRDQNRTELSRLGSSKGLYATTSGEMDVETVLPAAATAEYTASQTFAAWADDEPNAEAREEFARLAAEEQDHYEAVAAKLGAHDPENEPTAVHEQLREFDDTVERLGGVVGRALVSDAFKEQLIGFFVGDADPQTATLFRDLRSDLDEQLDRSLQQLAALCDSDEEWDRALAAANDIIELAYDEYVDALEELGVNPKPVC